MEGLEVGVVVPRLKRCHRVLEMKVNEAATNTEAEQAKRLAIVELLLPHYGKETKQLLEAATSVQGHIEGRPLSPPSSSGSTA